MKLKNIRADVLYRSKENESLLIKLTGWEFYIVVDLDGISVNLFYNLPDVLIHYPDLSKVTEE